VVCGLIGAFACSGTEGAPFSAVDAPAPTVHGAIARAEVERDLTLTLRQATPASFEQGEDPHFVVVLKNTSADRTYPVVVSSDGSEAGWREPHVFYTVERRVAGTPWEAAAQEPLLRCGNYDVDWTKDIVALAPGQELTLPWFTFYDQWDVVGASAMRVVAHYGYGDHVKDLRKVPPTLHPMPAFALASNALELAVEEPLALELRMKGPLPPASQPLAPAIDVVAVNRTTRALPFATADSGAVLELDVEGTDTEGAARRYGLDTSIFSSAPAHDTLGPGERRSVLSAQTKLEDSFLPPGFHVTRVRARLHIHYAGEGENAADKSRIAHSPWVAVK